MSRMRLLPVILCGRTWKCFVRKFKHFIGLRLKDLKKESLYCPFSLLFQEACSDYCLYPANFHYQLLENTSTNHDVSIGLFADYSIILPIL